MVSSKIKIQKGVLELEDGQLTDKWSQTGYALVKSGIIQDIIDFKLRNNDKWEALSMDSDGWRFVYEVWAENQMQKTQKVERLKRGRFYIGVKPDEGSVLETDYPLVYVNPLAKKNWLRGVNDVGLVFIGSPLIARLCQVTKDWKQFREDSRNYNWMGNPLQEGSNAREWAAAKSNAGILDEEWAEEKRKKVYDIGESPIKKAGWEFYPVDLSHSLRFGLFNWWW